MFPIYMWVKKYKGLENFGITFDNNYEIKFNEKEGTLEINRKCEPVNNNIENFYSIDKTKGNIDSVNLLIGKNGSGKTRVLELLTLMKKIESGEDWRELVSYKKASLFQSSNIVLSKSDCFIIYKNFENEKEEKFIFEIYNAGSSDEEEEIRYELQKTGIAKFDLFNNYDNISDNDFYLGMIKKINIKYSSKEKTYEYLNNQKELREKNFENAKIIISVEDMYNVSEYFSTIKNILTNNNEDSVSNDSKYYYDLMRLYKTRREEDIKDIILKNYCNELFLREIFYGNSKITEDIIEREKENIKDRNINEIYLKLSRDRVRKNFRKRFYDDIIKISQNISDLVKNDKIVKIIDIEDDKLAKLYINKYKNDKDIRIFLEFYDTFIMSSSKTYDRLKTEFRGDDIEKIIPIFVEGVSAGEKVKLKYFSSIYGLLNGEFKDKKYITLLFDEAETFLHPEWSRRFLYELIKELERYEDKKFKLIFATHSPFLIADVLAKDCIYLSKNKKGKIKAEIKEDMKTFGANIIDLFKNTMFLESTFGKFATEKIKGAVDKIEKAEKYSDIKHEVDFIIDEIGEKLISNKLKSMIKSKFENKDEEKAEEYYRKKIEEYQAKLDELEKKENNRNSKK